MLTLHGLSLVSRLCSPHFAIHSSLSSRVFQHLGCILSSSSSDTSSMPQPVVPSRSLPMSLPHPGLDGGSRLTTLSGTPPATMFPLLYKPLAFRDHPANHSLPDGLAAERLINTAAAAAAKSLQSCPTLCDPIDGKPTRLPRPWDSPGKNTGVGCHFLLQPMKVKSQSEVAQLCPTRSDLMDCSHGSPVVRGKSKEGRIEESKGVLFGW